jgi:beta-glucosidase
MDIGQIIEMMSLDEKISLCSGADFWHTKSIERIDLPSIMLSDGPHGLRKQELESDHLGLNKSIRAICFPAACASACSFDRELMYKFGKHLGEECLAENITVLLGPGINIKRSPLCGRNFEYISEDPYLSGELAAAYINGVQSMNIGTSLKHFAANNQEYERLVSSSEVDERTLREIYLTAFEIAVKKSSPWTIMSSYNRINGTYTSEDPWLLNQILRNEWGYEGVVISDWGGVSDRIAGLKAGMDLEMPGNNGVNDRRIRESIEKGILSEQKLNESVERLIRLGQKKRKCESVNGIDYPKDHMQAVKIATESVVLLKNNDVLPLQKNSKKILFVGEFAEKPRYQGGGSSHVNPYYVSDIIKNARQYAPVKYEKGFVSTGDYIDEILAEKALQAAELADTIVVFAGLPESFESEGYDRKHMQMPECQNQLITKLAKLKKKIVVVLQNGSPVEMPWIDLVDGVFETYLGGEGIGEAIVQLIFGEKNPCGKLAESFPLRLQDTPSYLNFPGVGQKVEYREGVFVGYRYYDSKEIEVLFPFGHGLSYTTFEYSNPRVSNTQIYDTEGVRVSIDVTNTGKYSGKEIVQLYVRDTTEKAIRPDKELKNFIKIELEPNETKTVEMILDQRSFAWYNTQMNDWYAADGIYSILIGKSSRCIEAQIDIELKATKQPEWVVDKDTKLELLLKNPKTKAYAVDNIFPHFDKITKNLSDGLSQEMAFAMLGSRTIRSARSFNQVSNEKIDEYVSTLNALLLQNCGEEGESI